MFLDQYDVECTVKADTSMVKRTERLSYNNGRLRVYYQIEFDIVLLFGLTELKAQIAYVENVSKHYSSFARLGFHTIFLQLLGHREEVR